MSIDEPNADMKPELPVLDQDKAVSPHAQEVEFALLLSKMINTVKEDPSQMRLAIYQFARARLQTDTTWADEPERTRLSAALETAIQGVEQFSAREEEKERLQPPAATALIGSGGPAAELMVPIYQINSAPTAAMVPSEVDPRPEAPVAALPTRGRLSTLARVAALLLAVGIGWAGYGQRAPLLRLAGLTSDSPTAATAAQPETSTSLPGPSEQGARPAEAKTAAVSAVSLPFPLPSDYGVYAVNNAALSELSVLTEQVPDKRIAMSTPLSQPSRTTIPDGKAKFVVFRRDLAGDALDRIDVRVVAKVVRAVTFDAKGKPSFSSVSDAWNIRNIAYEFRVRPLPGNPEMLLVQPATPDFALPAGRYVLVLKNQGYDFTVAGKVTDPSQCLERTDAANGEFYSGCQKQ